MTKAGDDRVRSEGMTGEFGPARVEAAKRLAGIEPEARARAVGATWDGSDDARNLPRTGGSK